MLKYYMMICYCQEINTEKLTSQQSNICQYRDSLLMIFSIVFGITILKITAMGQLYYVELRKHLKNHYV